MESRDAVVIKDQMLINIGESYIVTNLKYCDGDQHARLKLKVFTVNKNEAPDLYSMHQLDQVLVVGRSPNCDIRLEDDLLSKMQATIFYSHNLQQWVI